MKPGRITGFLGPNGAGKTTTMRAIFGLVNPDQGTMSWQGAPVDAGQRLHFGYMPEERGLYPRMEVDRQLAYFARLHGVDRAPAQSAAESWIQRLGLSGRGGSRVEALSHGNQQRVQLAAALIHDPELIVLDEPFSGLDPLAVKTMSGVLRQLAEDGAAVLLSSHQLDLVEDVCQEVVIVSRGKVVLTGTIDQIRKAHPYRVLEVGLETGAEKWHPGDDSARLLERRKGWCRYLVDKRTEPQQALAQAHDAGEVTHFFYGAPPLSEIFVDAVGALDDAPSGEGRT